MRQRVRVAIADQQIPFRAGVIAVLTAAGFDVVAEGSTADAILTVVEAGDSEVVIVDEDAFAVVCARAATTAAATAVVVPCPTPEVVADHVSRGARAVIPRATSARQLRSIVRDVAAGDIRVPNDVLTALIEAVRGARGVLRDVDGTEVRLTRRQAQIVQLHDLGRTTIEIATTLRLSPITVRRHLCDARHAATGAGDASRPVRPYADRRWESAAPPLSESGSRRVATGPRRFSGCELDHATERRAVEPSE